jgi:hypothetical protein
MGVAETLSPSASALSKSSQDTRGGPALENVGRRDGGREEGKKGVIKGERRGDKEVYEG